MTERLPAAPEGQTIRRQLADASTSVGANIHEANGAISRKDTRKSFVVAVKELHECRYWLRLIHAKWHALGEAAALLQEAQELMSIVGSIVSKLGRSA